MDPDSLKPGDKVRVSWAGYWAHGKTAEVAEGSREWGVPIVYTGPGQPGVVVVEPEVLRFVSRGERP